MRWNHCANSVNTAFIVCQNPNRILTLLRHVGSLNHTRNLFLLSLSLLSFSSLMSFYWRTLAWNVKESLGVKVIHQLISAQTTFSCLCCWHIQTFCREIAIFVLHSQLKTFRQLEKLALHSSLCYLTNW